MDAKVPPDETLLRVLRGIRWRMAWGRWLEGWVRLGAVVGTLVFGAGLGRVLVLGLPAWSPWLAAGGGILFVVGLPVWAWSVWPGLWEVAMELDRRTGSADRFVTGMVLGSVAERSAMQELAWQDCRVFAGRGGFEGCFPLRGPRGVLALVAPLVSYGLLVWTGGLEEAGRRAVLDSGLREVAGVSGALEVLAGEVERRGATEGDPALKEVAEQLRQGARDLKADARDPESARKAALRELSRLEQMVRALQEGGMPGRAQDLKALAESLAGVEGLGELARALEEGRFSDAARALSDLGGGASAGEAAKRIEEALQRLADQSTRSEEVNRLLEELERSGGRGALEKLQQLMQQLAQGNRGRRSGGEPGRAEDLKELLSALQNLKYGNPASGEGGGGNSEGGKGGGGGRGGGDGRVAVEVYGQAGRERDAGGGASGLAGGERDFGTTAVPFGAGGGQGAESGVELQLSGRLGQGETLSAYVPAAGDDSKSGRRYRELYEAMAPEAREAVNQEAIPIGARFFIQRYFELIRPR